MKENDQLLSVLCPRAEVFVPSLINASQSSLYTLPHTVEDPVTTKTDVNSMCSNAPSLLRPKAWSDTLE